VASQNQACIGLKANQRNLLKQAQQVTQDALPLSQTAATDLTHGRTVTRRIQVFAAPPNSVQAWPGLAAFVAVERWGEREGKPFRTQSWFILTQVMHATAVADLIRHHRGSIENKLHWVKDVVQAEDQATLHAPKPATLMAALRSWAISAFRQAGHDSITKAMRLYKHDLPKLISFL
jgi:predicted transposase YbfD/YdcC